MKIGNFGTMVINYTIGTLSTMATMVNTKR